MPFLLAVTLIQRFGPVHNLNLHFHLLHLGGVCDRKEYCWPVKPINPEDLDGIIHKIAKRVARYLERAGYLYRDAESEYLDLMSGEDAAMHDIIGASSDASYRTYRRAFGLNAGKEAGEQRQCECCLEDTLKTMTQTKPIAKAVFYELTRTGTVNRLN